MIKILIIFLCIGLICIPIFIPLCKDIIKSMRVEYTPFVKSAWFTNDYVDGVRIKYKYVTFFGKVKIWDMKTNKVIDEAYITGVKYD